MALDHDFANLARIAGADIHAGIAKTIAPLGAVLRCTSCSNAKSATAESVEEYLRSGWPACCGLTMYFEPHTDAGNDEQVLRDYDRELAGLDICVKAFESVDEAARRRMLEYLHKRYGDD